MTMLRKVVQTLSAIALVGAAGCGPTHYRNALHPQYGQTEFDRDWYECRREKTHPVTGSYAYGYAKIAGSDTRMQVAEAMARQCLSARGWREVQWQPQAPPLARPPLMPSDGGPPLTQGEAPRACEWGWNSVTRRCGTFRDWQPCDWGAYWDSASGQYLKVGGKLAVGLKFLP